MNTLRYKLIENRKALATKLLSFEQFPESCPHDGCQLARGLLFVTPISPWYRGEDGTLAQVKCSLPRGEKPIIKHTGWDTQSIGVAASCKYIRGSKDERGTKGALRSYSDAKPDFGYLRTPSVETPLHYHGRAGCVSSVPAVFDYTLVHRSRYFEICFNVYLC